MKFMKNKMSYFIFQTGYLGPDGENVLHHVMEDSENETERVHHHGLDALEIRKILAYVTLKPAEV